MMPSAMRSAWIENACAIGVALLVLAVEWPNIAPEEINGYPRALSFAGLAAIVSTPVVLIASFRQRFPILRYVGWSLLALMVFLSF